MNNLSSVVSAKSYIAERNLKGLDDDPPCGTCPFCVRAVIGRQIHLAIAKHADDSAGRAMVFASVLTNQIARVTIVDRTIVLLKRTETWKRELTDR